MCYNAVDTRLTITYTKGSPLFQTMAYDWSSLSLYPRLCSARIQIWRDDIRLMLMTCDPNFRVAQPCRCRNTHFGLLKTTGTPGPPDKGARCVHPPKEQSFVLGVAGHNPRMSPQDWRSVMLVISLKNSIGFPTAPLFLQIHILPPGPDTRVHHIPVSALI